MKTKQAVSESLNAQCQRISAHPIATAPQNSESFGIVPQISNRPNPEDSDSQLSVRKPHPESLEERISAEQRSRLFEWLAEHSYTEVQGLVAVLPPEGFGLSVGKSTLSRFYKAHFVEIDTIRQLRLDARAFAISQINQGGDYAETLNNSSRQLLLERYFEMLSHPLESIDDLKKLVAIADKIHSLHADARRAAKMEQLFGRLHPSSPSDSNSNSSNPHPS